jgi:hypothetical protein
MSTKSPGEPTGDAPINPGLHREVDASHGTEFRGTDPMTTLSVQDPEEGSSWPWIWAIVAIVCVAIAIYYVLT